MTNLQQYKTIYFIGAGGIGMSALARYFRHLGKNVLGYDKTPTKLTEALMAEGIPIVFEDKIDSQITMLNPEDTLVVFTPAIKKLDILSYFQQNNFTVLKRAKVLGLITQDTECIAVAGTHGKTTTSSLIAHLSREAGLPFAAFLGGIAENFASNFHFSGEKYTVLEADEYDRSFLNLHPAWAVITSTDADHLDIYGDRETIEEGFREFAALVPNGQQLFVRKGLNIGRPAVTYAVNEPADYYSDNLRMQEGAIVFDFHHDEKVYPDFKWEIPGIHNVENATAALALLHRLGVPLDTLKAGLAKFKGIKRRYTKHILPDGRIYIDDYAHHPTELQAVMGSVRTFYPGKKLLVVFQPHLYSRTRDFADGFAETLSGADELVLIDIYPARELAEDFEGVTSSWLSEKITLDRKEVCTLGDAMERIRQKDFDILLTVGAGDIDTLYEPILKWLNHQ